MKPHRSECRSSVAQRLFSSVVNDRGPSHPAHKIKAFLEEHRGADIVVCTGSASVKGLAWLARQAGSDRRITIVIGDMTGQSFAAANDDDRRVAAAFLRRSDVKVHNWYRQKPVKKIAHGKAVVALQSGGNKAVAALVGSANLTDKGLSENLELMVRCDPGELDEIDAYIAEATKHPPANDKLIGFVAKDKSVRFATKEEPQAAVISMTQNYPCSEIRVGNNSWCRHPRSMHLGACQKLRMVTREPVSVLVLLEQGQSAGELSGHADLPRWRPWRFLRSLR